MTQIMTKYMDRTLRYVQVTPLVPWFEALGEQDSFLMLVHSV